MVLQLELNNDTELNKGDIEYILASKRLYTVESLGLVECLYAITVTKLKGRLMQIVEKV